MGKTITCEWILCSERLPTVEEIRENNTFICTNGLGTFIRSYSFRWAGFTMVLNGKESKDRSITAWMPLPEPYKEAKAEV